MNRSSGFTDGSRTERSIAGNTPVGTGVGEPVAATPFNRDKLTCSLRGIDAESFDVHATLARARRAWWQGKPCIPPTHGAPGFIALLVVLAVTLTLARHASAQTPADQAPTNLTVRLTNGAVTLSWTAPAEDAASVTGYQVLRRRPEEGESAFQTLVADTVSTSTTYVDATAGEDGVRYEYQVQVLRGVTASAVSNTADLTLPFNLCERTQEVEAALLAAVAATDCALVPGSR